MKNMPIASAAPGTTANPSIQRQLEGPMPFRAKEAM